MKIYVNKHKELILKFDFASVIETLVPEVDQPESVHGAGDCGVEPFEVVHRQLILPERIVHEDARPLSALALVAGDRIGIFQLQGIVERVLTHCFVTFLLGSDVRIVRVDPLIEIVLLLVGQGCGLGVQGVETDFRHEFSIVIIRERKTGIGESQAVRQKNLP